jgi:hypothetical protein
MQKLLRQATTEQRRSNVQNSIFHFHRHARQSLANADPDAAPFTDARGVPRFMGGKPDIGAYEVVDFSRWKFLLLPAIFKG